MPINRNVTSLEASMRQAARFTQVAALSLLEDGR